MSCNGSVFDSLRPVCLTVQYICQGLSACLQQSKKTWQVSEIRQVLHCIVILYRSYRMITSACTPHWQPAGSILTRNPQNPGFCR